MKSIQRAVIVFAALACLVSGQARAGEPISLYKSPLGTPYRLVHRSNAFFLVPASPQHRNAEQILNEVFDAANGALYVNAVSTGGGAASSQFFNLEQIFNKTYDAGNGAIQVNCISGCGAANDAFKVNSTILSSSAIINFQNSDATDGLTLSFSNPSAGNIKLGFSGILTGAGGGTGADLSGAASGKYPKANGSGAFSASALAAAGTGACGANQFATALNGDSSPTCAQPAASNVTGLAASATTDATDAGNISSGTLAASRLPNPSSSTLGGTQSLANSAWTIVQTVAHASPVTITSTGAGNLIVVATQGSNGTSVSSVTDNASNTYVSAAAKSPGSNGNTELWYILNSNFGATTITVNGAGTVNVVVYEVSPGTGTFTLDAVNFDSSQQSASATPSVPAVTSTLIGDFMAAVMYSTGTVSAVSGGSEFTLDSTAGGNAWAHLTSSAQTAASHQVTFASTNSSHNGSIAAFKLSHVYQDGLSTAGIPHSLKIGYGDLYGTPSPVLSGTTGAIGGSSLLIGQCTAGTASITGATTSMVATASPSADPDSSLSAGVAIYAFVSSSGTATVRVCALATVTPVSTTYNVRVIQ